MASGHPRDEFGRIMPDSAWPVDKAAPEPWDIIRRFCNTANRESGADRFDTDEGLYRWLREQGIGGSMQSPADRARIVAFREVVRAHAIAHHDGTVSPELDDALGRHVSDLELTITAQHGRLEAIPAAGDAVGRTIGTVAMAIMGAQRANRWTRFKACRGCEWVFYDHSKNQSGRWCSMNACGGRSKVAAFRAREKASARSRAAAE